MAEAVFAPSAGNTSLDPTNVMLSGYSIEQCKDGLSPLVDILWIECYREEAYLADEVVLVIRKLRYWNVGRDWEKKRMRYLLRALN